MTEGLQMEKGAGSYDQYTHNLGSNYFDAASKTLSA